MPGYLLDTNIVSYFLKMPDSPLAKRIHSVPAPSICISTITEAALRYGILSISPEDWTTA